MSIAENLRRIEERIANAAAACGRSAESVRLIAVSKFVEAERVNEAIHAGVRRIGENRVQEFLEKHAQLLPVEAHFIGALQSKKAKQVTGRVACIHALDRPSLAEAIQDAAQRQGIVQDAMIQVRIGSEASKSGVEPEALFAFAESLTACGAIRVRGLMCIPPPATGDEARRSFAELRALLEKTHARGLLPADAHELSMGMSEDFEEAIAEGATMVRVGRAIFGER